MSPLLYLPEQQGALKVDILLEEDLTLVTPTSWSHLGPTFRCAGWAKCPDPAQYRTRPARAGRVAGGQERHEPATGAGMRCLQYRIDAAGGGWPRRHPAARSQRWPTAWRKAACIRRGWWIRW
ncbi:hypothetical protein ACU4GD_24105 [Cupriavidus basilensis]